MKIVFRREYLQARVLPRLISIEMKFNHLEMEDFGWLKTMRTRGGFQMTQFSSISNLK